MHALHARAHYVAATGIMRLGLGCYADRDATAAVICMQNA